MEVASVLGNSKASIPGVSNCGLSSFRPFHKHVEGRVAQKNSQSRERISSQTHCTSRPLICTSFTTPISWKSSGSSFLSRRLSNLSTANSRSPPVRPVQCSYSPETGTESEHSVFQRFISLSFESLKARVSQVTPFDLCKWSLIFSIAVAASKWTFNLLFNPFVWMYFSWLWLFWPWYVAISVGVYGLYCLKKHLKGEANEFEQIVIVTSAFTWLTLVPPAFFNGFLEGWPFIFFFVYHYFFFLNVSVRKRLYGDVYPREHDPKWDIKLPDWQRLLFCAGVMAGHWLAAFEGPELHLIPGGWSNWLIWGLIIMTIFMQYHATWYLAKYSEKVVVPLSIAQYGPFRFVRHPVYASTMLLFVTYFAALRAPKSALFIVAVCLAYYGQKAKLEEALMLEKFGKWYRMYMEKVKYKLIPFVY